MIMSQGNPGWSQLQLAAWSKKLGSDTVTALGPSSLETQFLRSVKFTQWYFSFIIILYFLLVRPMLCVMHLRENSNSFREWSMKILSKCCGKSGSRRALVGTDMSELSASATSSKGCCRPRGARGQAGKGPAPRTAASHNSPSGFPFSVSWMCVYTAPVSCSLLPLPPPPRYK